ncbi:putative membrane protein [Streptomyces lividans 1326]|uniref:Putative membrane protein n=1 Tax=Streptomyces lividans 1326 TaxID=1200984 RepID=A0A7U9DN83_STRLI|nr:putative membrane protein [Streptomyces lividans 1326]
MAPVAAAVFLIAYALAGRRERGFGRIAALLIPLELAADTVFTTGQHVCYGRAGGPVAGPLRSVGFDVLCGDGTGVHAGVTAPLTRVTGAETDRMASVLAQADPGTAWLLLAAHVGVGLLAAAWLRRGERALAQLLGAVAATTFRPLLLAVAAVGVRRAPAVRRPTPPARRTTGARERILTHSLGRRGPPCPVATLV